MIHNHALRFIWQHSDSVCADLEEVFLWSVISAEDTSQWPKFLEQQEHLCVCLFCVCVCAAGSLTHTQDVDHQHSVITVTSAEAGWVCEKDTWFCWSQAVRCNEQHTPTHTNTQWLAALGWWSSRSRNDYNEELIRGCISFLIRSSFDGNNFLYLKEQKWDQVCAVDAKEPQLKA